MDPQQFLTELDSELRSVIGTLLGTAPATHDVTAIDESGRVSLTLRPGRTLARVQVAADWEEEIESPARAATIVEVAGTAQGLVTGRKIRTPGWRSTRRTWSRPGTPC